MESGRIVNMQVYFQNIVNINQSTLQCSLLSTSPGPTDESIKTFTFDGVYDQLSTTEQIYTDFGYPLVEVYHYYL